MKNQLKGSREPAWRALRHTISAATAPEAALWLWDRASLTGRLRARCRHFEVVIGYEGWGGATVSEGRALGVATGRRCWLRHVHLVCDGRPVVFARTVIPVTTLTGRLRQLGRLGTRPLGEVLFGDATMERGLTEVARFSRGHRLFAAATAGVTPRPTENGERSANWDIWGRRSVFRVDARPLLVAELFLSSIADLSTPQPW